MILRILNRHPSKQLELQIPKIKKIQTLTTIKINAKINIVKLFLYFRVDSFRLPTFPSNLRKSYVLYCLNLIKFTRISRNQLHKHGTKKQISCSTQDGSKFYKSNTNHKTIKISLNSTPLACNYTNT